MAKKKKKIQDVNPATWRGRARAQGWERDPARTRDLATFAERVDALAAGTLLGVRVEYAKLEAWWSSEATFVGTGRDGQDAMLKLPHRLGTSMHHVPSPESVIAVENIAPSQEWCPAHVFACQPRKGRCGWACDGTRKCCCVVCLGAASNEMERHAPKRVEALLKPETAIATANHLFEAPVRVQKKPKNAKKAPLPGQLGLLGDSGKPR